MTKTNEFHRRGGAYTFEQLEAEATGQRAAAASTLSGADMTAEQEVVPKPEPKTGDAVDKTGK